MSIEAVGKHFIHKITKNVYTVLEFIPDITTRITDSRYRICPYGKEYPHRLTISCDALHAEYDLFEETTVEKQQDQQDKYIGKRFASDTGRVFEIIENLGKKVIYNAEYEDDYERHLFTDDFLDRLSEAPQKQEAAHKDELQQPKEEDYTGRYFVKDDLKFKVIGHRNKIVPNDYKYEWPWLIFKQCSTCWAIDNIRSEDLQSMTETDSNWVPLKKEFVIDKIGFYKTRSGKVAYVSHNDGSERMQWIVNIYGVPAFKWAYSNGRISFHRESCNDIVGPWEGE